MSKNTFTFRPENSEFFATIELDSLTEMGGIVCLCKERDDVTAFSQDKDIRSKVDTHPKVEVPMEVLIAFFEYLEENYSGK